MHVVITGGAGFIGSHLAEALVREGQAVTVLDDLSTGALANISHLSAEPRFTFVRGSVTDDALVGRLVGSADVVVHLAAAVGVRLVVARPLHTLETNVVGTETVLRHASRSRPLTVVASTSEVYGKNAIVPFREDDDLTLGVPTKCRWGYAVSKLFDECLALAYHQERQLPVVVVRLFNTVGPRQSSQFGMVLPAFIKWALAGEPLQIHGNGQQRRCFTWVGDVIAALQALIHQPRAVGGVFNIGNPEETTIESLAMRVRATVGSASQLVHLPHRDAFGPGFEDMNRRVPDISRIRELVGWVPRVPLEEIVARTVEYWRHQREAVVCQAPVAERGQAGSWRRPA
jgi:UDP-glucose 4-epimerase